MKPIVALVGRPNVGKSTLFNRITRSRDAIVDDLPGVTRDRLYGQGDWDGEEFVVIASHTGEEGMMLLAERIRENVAAMSCDGCGSELIFVEVGGGAQCRLCNKTWDSEELIVAIVNDASWGDNFMPFLF